jgi:alpha-L-arabinofuranosidase
MIMFNVADSSNWIWWNIGGWSNTKYGLEYCVNGTKTNGAQVSGTVATGQWYDIKVAVQGNAYSCYLNNVLTQSGTISGASSLGSIGLSTWNTQAEYRNIVVTGSNSQVLYQSDFDHVVPPYWQVGVDTSKPMNSLNPSALKLTILSGSNSLGVANSGYFGIPVLSGSIYNLSLYASGSNGFMGPVEARLESADGSAVYARTSFTGITSDWQKFSASLVPTANDTNARLVVSMSQPGTLWLDVVSLFPQALYNSRQNGTRPDLANALAAMKPSFLRFPGGCYVEGDKLANAFRWKKSMGDISQRPGHWDLWGYTSSDGMGYHEYLQFCEDIGAEPVFCINAGISHSDVVALANMGEFVQDALDAIEYANGDTSTTWGAQRAANGHPAPFNLKFMEIGNENGGTNYNDRYALFYDAIKAAYPQMRIISCVWGGTATSRPLDLIDEHYYTSAATFQSYATKYDTYSRSGPHIFVGEYAVTSGYGTYGNLSAALGEAAFMTGIERNCDIVTMASYAPLYCNLSEQNWKPDAIYFNNSQCFGTPSYYVQQMFANNMGSALLPISQDFSANNAGSIGLSTWNTQSEYRNIVVTGSDSQILYQSDFATSGTAGWVVKSGSWSVDSSVNPKAYSQTANGNDYRSTYSGAGSSAWKNYTLTLQARKNSGSEGFLILFNVADTNNWVWWNLGGWSNSTHAIEYLVNGTKTTGPKVSGSIATGEWYDIKIVIQGGSVNCYLNNVLTQTFNFPAPIYSVASLNAGTQEYILKTVNPTSSPIAANILLANCSAIGSTVTSTVLTSASALDENSLANPTKVSPAVSSVGASSPQFAVNLPANSLTILRAQGLALAPPNTSGSAGNQRAVLSWENAAGATSYTVKRATSISGPYSVVASGLAGNSFTDSSLTNGTTYYYLISSVNSAGETTSASTVAVTPVLPAIAPNELYAPSLLTGTSGVQITLKSSVPGRLYRLQRSDTLAPGSWIYTGDSQAGTGTDLLFMDAADPSQAKRFYRVELSPGPN